MNEDIFKIKCTKCKTLPLFDFTFDNKNNVIIKYKCHNENLEIFSLNNFIYESFKCEICEDKGINKCICGLFCKDDYLYHLLISKHILNKMKIENIQEFKYYFNNWDKIIEIKNEKHNNNDSLYNLKEGNYKYLNNENLIIPMIYYFK